MEGREGRQCKLPKVFTFGAGGVARNGGTTPSRSHRAPKGAVQAGASSSQPSTATPPDHAADAGAAKPTPSVTSPSLSHRGHMSTMTPASSMPPPPPQSKRLSARSHSGGEGTSVSRPLVSKAKAGDALDTYDDPQKIRRRIDAAPKLSSSMITVEVGDNAQKKSFKMHEDMLVKHSEYFKMMLTKEWKESKSRIVPMPEDNVESFELFAGFIYTGKVFSNMPSATIFQGLTDAQEFERFAHAWALGDKLLSTTFQDAVTDATFEKMYTTESGHLSSRTFPAMCFPNNMHSIVWSHSATRDCGIKKLLVDVAVNKWDTHTIRLMRYDEKVSKEFLSDVLIGTKEDQGLREGRLALSRLKSCQYHEHGANGDCYRSMF